MYLCVYVYVCIIHICIQMCTYIHIYIYMCVYTYVPRTSTKKWYPSRPIRNIPCTVDIEAHRQPHVGLVRYGLWGSYPGTEVHGSEFRIATIRGG